MGAIERELATALALASSLGDEARIGEAQAELAKLRKIEAAAELACGLLWMTAEWRQGKTDDAYKALRDALGGSGSKGLGKAIQRAMDSGAQVDAPPGCYWPEESAAYDPCDAPPIGWRCTRSKGHSGPCAAVAYPDDVDLVERGMQRLLETTNGTAQEFELVSCIPVANSPTQMAPAAVPVVQTPPLHSQTVRDLLGCCRAWEPDVRILGNVRAADAAAALAYMLPHLEAEDRFYCPPCMECGATTLEEAGRKCICAGDKDDCHGSRLWPDHQK